MHVFSRKQLHVTVVLQVLGTLLFGCAFSRAARAQDDWFTQYIKNQKKTEAAPVKDGPSYLVDVVVLDQRGQPVNWLHPGDFTLNDNQEEQKLIGFNAVDQTVVKTEDVNDSQVAPRVSVEPQEVILVVDAVNLTPPQLTQVRKQLDKYLRGTGGQLPALTRFVIFSGAGMQFESPIQLNGNALADQLSKQPMQVAAAGSMSDVDRFKVSVSNLRMIVDGEGKSPGHKLLFWIGPGWPLNASDGSSTKNSEQASNFDAIVALQNGLREARMEIFNLRISADDESSANGYLNYLKPVNRKDQVETGNLALQVLAVQSGGRVSIPSGDVAGEVARTVSEESTYYTLKFKGRMTGKQLDYHELQVQIGQPGARARLVSGYYEAP